MKGLILFIVLVPLALGCSTEKGEVPGKVTPPHGLKVENGIHIDTGLKDDPDLPLIIANCTACHSAQLIVQNRASREGWKSMITWMQETQKLWDLGTNEDAILNYLEKNYSPDESVGRRATLTDIEWYELED